MMHHPMHLLDASVPWCCIWWTYMYARMLVFVCYLSSVV